MNQIIKNIYERRNKETSLVYRQEFFSKILYTHHTINLILVFFIKFLLSSFGARTITFPY